MGNENGRSGGRNWGRDALHEKRISKKRKKGLQPHFAKTLNLH